MNDERFFLDTNVLVYLFDEENPNKQSAASNLINQPDRQIVLSVQVLGEFFHVVTRKLKQPLSSSQAFHVANSFHRYEVRPIDSLLIRKAMERQIASELSYWDSLIVESAIDAEATFPVTEDLHHGQRFGALEIRNPFRDSS